MSTPTAARPASETSAHWYRADGTPMHFVDRSDGKGTRPTTLRDAKKLGLLPSPTSILKVLRAPALESWMIEQACLAVLTAPRREGEALDAFVERVLHTERQQDEQAKVARELGTDIHAGIEAVLQGEPCPSAVEAFVLPAVEQMRTAFGQPETVEKVVTYGGCAGRLDAIFYRGHMRTVIDVKTTGNPPTKGSYLEHRLQLSFYAQAVERDGHDVQTANVYVGTKTPGVVVIDIHKDWKTTFEQGFTPLLEYWCFANNYRP